jgi:ferric-dicitrate binding protein FerR (iron transport regulator)
MHERDSTSEEARLASLLRAAGARETPPEELSDQVRAAAYDEWQTVVATRKRRRMRTYALAASIAALAVIGICLAVIASAPRPEVAQVVQVEGDVTLDEGWLARARAVDMNGAVRAGGRIVSGHEGFAELELGDGIRVSLDENSTVRVAAADRVALERGGIFVATAGAARSASFAVATARGNVRHLGTQYEVRTVERDVHVSVREGRVIVESNGAIHEGVAGERLQLVASGDLVRTALSAHGDVWAPWRRSLPDIASFDIEAQSLHAFLEWFMRETGRRVEFASQEAVALARTTILHGSIDGMDPDTALATVLATTDFSRADSNDGRVVLSTSP